MNAFFDGRSRAILSALAAALVLGGLLYWQASRPPVFPAPVDFGEGLQAQAFWADDLRDYRGLKLEEFDGAIAPDGATLSHLQREDGKVISWSAAGPGVLYGYNRDWHLIVYNLASETFTDLQPLLVNTRTQFFGAPTVAPDGRMYTLAGEPSQNRVVPQQLLEYDPGSGQLRFLTEVVSMTAMIVAGRDGRVYGFVRPSLYRPLLARPQFAYDLASKTRLALGDAPAPNIDFSLAQVGDDGLLYGKLEAQHGSASVFALDLASGTLITQALLVGLESPVLRPGGGAYFAANDSIWLFDPQQKSLTTLFEQPATVLNVLTVLKDGRLLGFGQDNSSAYWYWQSRGFFFTFAPTTGHFERLEAQPYWLNPRTAVAASDGRAYTVVSGRVVAITPDAYAPSASIESETIEPMALILTRTLTGGSSSATRALACAPNGRVYGVLSSAGDYYDLYRPATSYTTHIGPYPADPQWLFWHDPQVSDVTLASVRPALQPDAFGGTALVALGDGRLVGGTSDGRVFAYDPATGATRDFGKPIAGAWQIATLALGRDGLVYGGTATYDQATLFSLDPDSGAITDLGAGLPQSHLVGAIAVAPDGRVYAGAGNALVVYDPATHDLSQVGTLGQRGECAIRALTQGAAGQIYGGCGLHLLSYAPGDAQAQDLGPVFESQSYGSPQITALVTGADGRLYGSLDFGYGSDAPLFVYDPVARQSQVLGMAVPGSIMSLAACSNGAIYVGSGTNHSMYGGPAYMFAFSPQCPHGVLGQWGRVTWEADTPPGTAIRVDVLDANRRVLIADVKNGDVLSMLDALAHPRLALRATLSTSDPQVAPVLKHWRVDYTFQCQR